eukprot:CAMPEP_0206311156 /NCGR_PEP_ID=MMETSP0106_2-20121207/13304_1 /ASSEMBLY_ACC=CAM_ASM_000206 /TAXON_ID=81532 /ORGANISM="Acanthoeca-like sp., Strain 10tr" /LENGTH=427 /DNA_ID=CAMNT_0053742367 /DNA_START=1 /DNA_END=1281 /DNA_ORIENTATION=+
MQIPCPPEGNTNGTQSCTYHNTATADVVVEVNFQVLDTVSGSIECEVDKHIVCAYTAESAQYDGKPCWMLLPKGSTLQCTTKGKFYSMGAWGHVLAPAGLVAPGWGKPAECPGLGPGKDCSSSNTASTDEWVTVVSESTSFDDMWMWCNVSNVTVCRYRSRFGRVQTASCSFLVPAGLPIECHFDGSGDTVPKVTSTVVVPLTKAIAPPPPPPGGPGLWRELPCPFGLPQYQPNDCPCTANLSLTEDALVHLEVASPDAADNSIWCFGSGGEDLCSFTWNGGEGDVGTCTFFLPAAESIGCKIQFGSVDVVSALWTPLTTPIFRKGAAGGPAVGSAMGPAPAATATQPRHWDRLIAHDPARGPADRHAIAAAARAPALWPAFKQRHRKTYDSPAEDAARFGHFVGSLTQIARLSESHPEATFGLNAH